MSPRDGARHRVGLLGCGSFGAFLADAIAELPTAELAAVADMNKDLAVRVAATHPSAAIETDLDGLLTDRHIDIVVIATPPWTHATLAVQALRAGRHVLVEKPLATDVDGCRRVAEAASDTGKTVGVDHLLRFAPLVTVLDRLLAVEVAGRRALGPIRRFAFENDAADEDLPADHWFWDTRRSGGIFIEHGVHFFDLAANLIGSPVDAIQALPSTRADGRTDTVCATARYQDGATASWYHSFTHPRHGERQLLRVDLANGECRLTGWIPLEMQLEAWTDGVAVEALHSAATDIGDLDVPERDVEVTMVAARNGRRSGRNPPPVYPTRSRHAGQVDCIRDVRPEAPHRLLRRRRPSQTTAHRRRRSQRRHRRGGRRNRGGPDRPHVDIDPIRTLIRSREGDSMIHTSSPRRPTRFAVGAIAAMTAWSGLVAPMGGASAQVAQAAPAVPLTNLAHLDWLGDQVSPPAQDGHTTYRLAEEPEIGVLWTYADRQADGTYRRIGGGDYDPATNTYGQGAFNADDISRAAVVYIRHWQQTGSQSSRRSAYQLLRGLTYMQTVEGDDAGNVVLWMQPDGTLNPSAKPAEQPDPSDSDASYWLARTIWALGEAYPAFVDTDPAFAGFLRDRLDLALRAVEREVLVRYGQWLDIDGVAVPAWLIVDGADATGEALLGLSRYVAATGDTQARLDLQRLAEGVAAMRSGDSRTWPFGAVLPWARSQADWHAWAGLAPAGLARASEVTGDSAMRRAAVSDAATFTTHLLVAAGPENGWLPSPTDHVQIAYGAHSRVESLLATAEAANRPGLREVAGIAAAWFFGNNPAGVAMYDPATGRTYDGINPGDTKNPVNRNSGAESTIHGLLTMEILDREADVRALALVAHVRERQTWRLVEAESGQLGSRASVYQPASAWTGESLWSGGAGVQLSPGGTLKISVKGIAAGPNLLMPVVLLDPSAGTTKWRTPRRVAGTVQHSRVGPQGDSPAPGLLAVETLPKTVKDIDSVVVQGSKRDSLVDALLVQPEIEHLVLANDSNATALLRSFAHHTERVKISLPVGTTARVESYDRTGRLATSTSAPADDVVVRIPGGGFAVVRSS